MEFNESSQSRRKSPNKCYRQMVRNEKESFSTDGSHSNSSSTTDNEWLNTTNDEDFSVRSSDDDSDESNSLVEVPRRPRRKMSRSKRKGYRLTTAERDRIALNAGSFNTVSAEDSSPTSKKPTEGRVLGRPYEVTTSDTESMLSELSELDNDVKLIVLGGQRDDFMTVTRKSMEVAKRLRRNKAESKERDSANSKKINRWLEKLGKIGSGGSGHEREKILLTQKARKARSNRSLLGDSDHFDSEESFYDDCSDFGHDSATDRTLGSGNNPGSRSSRCKTDLGELAITEFHEKSVQCKMVNDDGLPDADDVTSTPSSIDTQFPGRINSCNPECLSPSITDETEGIVSSLLLSMDHVVPTSEEIHLFADENQLQPYESPALGAKSRHTFQCSLSSVFNDVSASRGRPAVSVTKFIKSSSEHMRPSWSYSERDKSSNPKSALTSTLDVNADNASSSDPGERRSSSHHSCRKVRAGAKSHSHDSSLHDGREWVSETRTRATLRRSRSGSEHASEAGPQYRYRSLSSTQGGYDPNSLMQQSLESATDYLSFQKGKDVFPNEIRVDSHDKSRPAKSRYSRSSLKEIVDMNERNSLLLSQVGNPINVGKYFAASTVTSIEAHDDSAMEVQYDGRLLTSHERESRSQLGYKVRSSSHSESRVKGRRKLITRTYSASGLLL